MINFIVVTHGEFGAYLVEAAESIVGRQAGVRVISISPRIPVSEIRERVQRAVTDLAGSEGLVLFTDMPGGSPSNLSFPLIKDQARAEMISGVNLYMLVSAFNRRREGMSADIVAKIIADGKKSIRDIRQMFVSRLEV